jgi:hypothetical protein
MCVLCKLWSISGSMMAIVCLKPYFSFSKLHVLFKMFPQKEVWHSKVWRLHGKRATPNNVFTKNACSKTDVAFSVYVINPLCWNEHSLTHPHLSDTRHVLCCKCVLTLRSVVVFSTALPGYLMQQNNIYSLWHCISFIVNSQCFKAHLIINVPFISMIQIFFPGSLKVISSEYNCLKTSIKKTYQHWPGTYQLLVLSFVDGTFLWDHQLHFHLLSCDCSVFQ